VIALIEVPLAGASGLCTHYQVGKFLARGAIPQSILLDKIYYDGVESGYFYNKNRRFKPVADLKTSVGYPRGIAPVRLTFLLYNMNRDRIPSPSSLDPRSTKLVSMA
jgi:hypothetical protein